LLCPALIQADTTSAEGPGGGLFGGLLNGMGSGMGNGMGLGLLDRLDASTLGWDDITFGRATEQLNEVCVLCISTCANASLLSILDLRF